MEGYRSVLLRSSVCSLSRKQTFRQFRCAAPNPPSFASQNRGIGSRLPAKKIARRSKRSRAIFMAGMEGFEPPNASTKNWCLTTWRHPIIVIVICFSVDLLNLVQYLFFFCCSCKQEPTGWCLTTWPRPKIQELLYHEQQSYQSSYMLWITIGGTIISLN